MLFIYKNIFYKINNLIIKLINTCGNMKPPYISVYFNCVIPVYLHLVCSS